MNPTVTHLEHAEELRVAAAEHRSAAATLRAAESASCAGVRDVDRDMSPFDHEDDIVAVATAADGKSVTITLRAPSGMSEAALKSIIDCHIARNAAMGFTMPEMSFCPLSVRGATASVAKVPEGLAVTIRGADDAAAAEIISRTNALRSRK